MPPVVPVAKSPGAVAVTVPVVRIFNCCAVPIASKPEVKVKACVDVLVVVSDTVLLPAPPVFITVNPLRVSGKPSPVTCGPVPLYIK